MILELSVHFGMMHVTASELEASLLCIWAALAEF